LDEGRRREGEEGNVPKTSRGVIEALKRTVEEVMRRMSCGKDAEMRIRIF
jgi:hypothetical protein